MTRAQAAQSSWVPPAAVKTSLSSSRSSSASTPGIGSSGPASSNGPSAAAQSQPARTTTVDQADHRNAGYRMRQHPGIHHRGLNGRIRPQRRYHAQAMVALDQPGEILKSAHVSSVTRSDGYQVADEDKGLPRCDHAGGATLAIGQVRRDDQLAAAAYLHPLQALVPAGDDPAGTELELQRRAPVPAGVELLASGVGHAHVVDLDLVPRLGLRPVAFPDLGDLQIGGRGPLREVNLGLFDAQRIPPCSAGNPTYATRTPAGPGPRLAGNQDAGRGHYS